MGKSSRLQPTRYPTLTGFFKPDSIVKPGGSPRPEFNSLGLNDESAPFFRAGQSLLPVEPRLDFVNFFLERFPGGNGVRLVTGPCAHLRAPRAGIKIGIRDFSIGRGSMAKDFNLAVLGVPRENHGD